MSTETIERASEEIKTMVRPPSLPSQPYPWLLISNDEKWEHRIFYSIGEDRYYVQYVHEMQDKYIETSYKGWLVLVGDDTNECLLLNLSTMEKVQLPAADVANYDLCVLSSQNMDGSCRVLFFNRCLNTFRSCHVGDVEFITHDLLIDYDEGVGLMAAINYEEKLYVMTMHNHLLCADIKDPFLHFTIVIRGDEVKGLLPYHFDLTRHYMVESLGELLFIYETGSAHELSDLKIHKADLDTKRWVPVTNLGDRAIFLDAANCYVASPASTFGLKGNSVYFVNKFGRNISIYNIEDESTSISLPCPIACYDSELSWVYVNSGIVKAL